MNTIEIAKKVFQEIQSEFPNISMQIDKEHEHVELNIDIPKQNGVNYPINLNLQNEDELHFSVRNFWFENFPCTDPVKVAEYKEIVIGYIQGKYRIVEYFKGKKAYKAYLQEPQNDKWSTIATWYRLSWPISFRRSHGIFKNV